MVLILYGSTAYEHWLQAVSRPLPAPCVTDLRRDSRPTASALDHLARTLPHLAPPYHLMVAANLHPSERLIPHRCDRRLPRGALLPVAPDIYAASPELCAVQIGRRCAEAQLAKAIMALCGLSAVQPAGHGLELRPPLTTCAAVRSFVTRNSALPGSRATRRAVDLAADRARSPAEADLFLQLSLPHRLGGLALSRPRLNHTVALTGRARRLAGQATVCADLAWPAVRLAVEYDSNLTHLTIAQHARDIMRREGMEADGWTVAVVTSGHLYGRRGLDELAYRIARALDERIRPRVADFPARRRSLQALPRGYGLPPELFT